jgi:hypothetical protein
MPKPDAPHMRISSRAPADEGASPFGGPESLEGTGHMRIARDGTWYHEGGPIRRNQLVKLFATVLRREEDGTYWLVTPVERVQVHVDDAPFTAQEVEAREDGGAPVLALRTNLDEWVEAGPDHPIFMAISPATGEMCPYIKIKPGLDALIARSVFYTLAEMAEPDPNEESGEATLGVWSHGTFFPLEPRD